VYAKPSERALELLEAKYNCAQAVFAACATDDGLTEGQRLALSAAFGGGAAKQGEICGALSGALMALGEMRSAVLAADPAAGRDAVIAQGKEMIAAFRAAHGSILCRELTGCLLYTEEGQRSFNEQDLRHKVCAKLVAFAADQAVAARK
jgi:C_GCAxxG_C_C family probable redox protein